MSEGLSLVDEAGNLKPFRQAKREFLNAYCRLAMQIAQGSVRMAARLAGKNRTEFYRLLMKNGWKPRPKSASEHWARGFQTGPSPGA